MAAQCRVHSARARDVRRRSRAVRQSLACRLASSLLAERGGKVDRRGPRTEHGRWASRTWRIAAFDPWRTDEFQRSHHEPEQAPLRRRSRAQNTRSGAEKRKVERGGKHGAEATPREVA